MRALVGQVKHNTARWARLCVWMCLAACSDEIRPSGTLIPNTDAGEQTSASTQQPLDEKCADKKDGTDCGSGKHCVKKRCLYNVCGDGSKAGDEQCDDGNQVVGDGCDANCRIECKDGDKRPECQAASSNEPGANGSSDCSADSCDEDPCGNGRVDPSEECDDGNKIDSDGCSDQCTKNECGNGRVDSGEECDDGNRNDNDSCPNSCQHSRCRNGVKDPGEECDDGNQVDNDGCTNRCKIQICGDGKVQEREECDDGNMVDTDSCSSKCTKNECGNARVDPGEECDEAINCVMCKRPKEDLCRKCEEAHCNMDFPEEGISFNLVGGCLDNNPDPMYVMNAVQPGMYSMPCMALLRCARENKCVTPDRGAQDCLCGSATVGDCQDRSKSTGPCQQQFLDATFTTKWIDIFQHVEDLSFPVGYASLLLKCDAARCQAECAPWLLMQ